MQEKETVNKEEAQVEEVVNESDEALDESIEEAEINKAEETNEEAKESVNEASDKKKLFKKKKDKRDEQLEELNDKLMRNMAEFDNFRKRSEKEKHQMFEIGAKDMIEKILPVIDNFERGLSSVPETDRDSAFVQGIEQIYKQLMTTLETAGVTAIDAVGKEFDPNLHNAVMHAEDENFGENIVSEELQKGYMYRDSVVRHSMVKVVN